MSERPAMAPGYVVRHCDHCGDEIWRWPADFHGKNTYCSRRCLYDSRMTPMPIRDQSTAANDANVPTKRPCPPWPVVKLPGDDVPHDPRPVIRGYFRAVRERWEVAS